MNKARKNKQSRLAEAAAKVKINKSLDASGTNWDTPSFRIKMEKGEQALAKAGLPKEK